MDVIGTFCAFLGFSLIIVGAHHMFRAPRPRHPGVGDRKSDWWFHVARCVCGEAHTIHACNAVLMRQLDGTWLADVKAPCDAHTQHLVSDARALMLRQHGATTKENPAAGLGDAVEAWLRDRSSAP